jgi:GNAT superfamily N-acetyltransferase
MPASQRQVPVREWHREARTTYRISTDSELLDHDFINASFAGPDMYWAKELPRDELAIMLQHSITLGLYKYSPEPSSPRTPSPTLADSESGCYEEEDWQQIGLARFATDHVTFAYLTDVYINPDHRASGLGSWLIECCREWMDGMPFLRRSMLMASEDFGKSYYAKALGMEDVAGMGHGLVCMSKTGPGSVLNDADVKH